MPKTRAAMTARNPPWASRPPATIRMRLRRIVMVFLRQFEPPLQLLLNQRCDVTREPWRASRRVSVHGGGFQTLTSFSSAAARTIRARL